MLEDLRRSHWARTRRLTVGLGLLWLLPTLVIPWFARSMQGLRVFGFPLAYWLTAVGLLILYLAIVVAYAIVMDRLEADYLRRLALIGDETGMAGR